MSQPIFDSVYLAEQPRRAKLSEARNRLQGQCSTDTLAGELEQAARSLEERGSGLVFWVQDADRDHPLKVGVNTIGRMPDNTVILNDSHVSRHHCAIIVHRNGNCEVHDIASKNGTILNGQVVAQPTPMKPGDILNLSNRRIVLRARLARTDEETPYPG
jgi:pSer/pThr/pTyr-binding forkhead associated (FHA) protein